MIEYTVVREFFRGPLDGRKEQEKVKSEETIIHRALSPQGLLNRTFEGQECQYELCGAFTSGPYAAVFRYRYPGEWIPFNGWGDNELLEASDRMAIRPEGDASGEEDDPGSTRCTPFSD